MQFRKLSLLFLAFAVIGLAQTSTSLTIGSIAGIITAAGSSGTATMWLTNGRDNETLYGVPTETRKDDGKGPTIHMVKLAAKHWESLPLAPGGYLARAEKIGLQSAGTDEARMLSAIHDAHLKVYEFAKVDDYLYRKALKQGTNVRWVWEPMRETDLKSVNGDQNHAGLVGQWKESDRKST